MAPRNRSKGSSDSSNPDIPVATPSFGSTDNWSLKALVELNSNMARMTSALENLSEKVQEVREDQQKQLARIDRVERKILVASAIVAVAIAFGGFVANKAIDFGLKMAEQHLAAPASAQQPARHQP